MGDLAEGPGTVAESFATLARVLLGTRGVAAALQKIVEEAVLAIDGCDHAAISLVRAHTIDTPAASDDVGRLVDAIQYEVGEGPCLEVIRQHRHFQDRRSPARSRAGPKFSARAARETGVRSMVAFQLFADEETMGALNLYSKSPAAFDEEAVNMGVVFAAHASVALNAAQTEEELRAAIVTRDVIGQAKGILMARQHVTADEAFTILRKASQRLNLKLRDVAGTVAAQAAGREPADGGTGRRRPTPRQGAPVPPRERRSSARRHTRLLTSAPSIQVGTEQGEIGRLHGRR